MVAVMVAVAVGVLVRVRVAVMVAVVVGVLVRVRVADMVMVLVRVRDGVNVFVGDGIPVVILPDALLIDIFPAPSRAHTVT